MDQAPLRIVPLGGLGEVGKNMMAIEYAGDVVIIDTGLMFPESDMLGIDYIIPDYNYLRQPGLSVKAIIVTHGHEDHTGAISHVLEDFPAPIYATPLTIGLLEVKLRSARLRDKANLVQFRAGDTLNIPPFRVDTFHVCHSIPDCVGLGIHTPIGLIVHTGDFKFDHTPVDNWPTDYARLAGFSEQGALLLLSDSTNADRPGWTPSERVIDEAFDKVFRKAPGRIIVATFASLISRIQQVADVAQRTGRKLAITGHSMSDNIRMATNLGYLTLPPGLIISVDEAIKLPPQQVVFMATGTQGEPSAVLSRLSNGRHQKLDIQPGDTVVISAHPIPGNEESVHRTINKLFRRGANVIYDPIAPVHVSGHASQEEQKLMISLVRPRYFIPIHGELRHLKAHAQIAEQLGIAPENVAVVENGTVIEFDHQQQMSISSRFPGGYVFVDGATVGDITAELLRERELLSRDGIVFTSVVVCKQTNQVVGEPIIFARGVAIEHDTDLLLGQMRETVRRAIERLPETDGSRDAAGYVQAELSRLIYSVTRHRPQVFAAVTET